MKKAVFSMKNNLILSVDVEKDLHTETYAGVTEGLKSFEKICDRYKIKPVLFITADCIKKHPAVFIRLKNKGWELSLHGLTHRRFDDMSCAEKEFEIKESLKIFKKYLKINPKGFRAPQHSIDNDTLDLLQKYDFEYDSSYTPLNIFQFLFFPRKFILNIKLFFSPLNLYKIRPGLYEKPCAAMIIPFVSLTLRVLPLWVIKSYISFLRLFYTKPIFYAHSWDFIPQKNSKIDNLFPHTNLLNKLGKILE